MTREQKATLEDVFYITCILGGLAGGLLWLGDSSSMAHTTASGLEKLQAKVSADDEKYQEVLIRLTHIEDKNQDLLAHLTHIENQLDTVKKKVVGP